MGRWINRILTPAAPSDEEAHIALEDLARLAEGRVDPEEKARYITHLNRCPDCYEILAGTLNDLSEESSKRPGWLASWSGRPLYALAASLVLFFLIGGGLYYQYRATHPPIIVASLALDQELKNILLENDKVQWVKTARIARLAGLLRKKGVQVKTLDRVQLARPYYSLPTKSLFRPKEILRIRIEKGVAYLEVAKE